MMVRDPMVTPARMSAPPPTHTSAPIWIGFSAFVIALLLLDLLVFNRKAHRIEWREATRLSAFFVGAALAVNVFVYYWSLAEHPATMTHADVEAADRARQGITPGLVRLSVGVEHYEDLLADLDQALAATTAAATA